MLHLSHVSESVADQRDCLDGSLKSGGHGASVAHLGLSDEHRDGSSTWSDGRGWMMYLRPPPLHGLGFLATYCCDLSYC